MRRFEKLYDNKLKENEKDQIHHSSMKGLSDSKRLNEDHKVNYENQKVEEKTNNRYSNDVSIPFL